MVVMTMDELSATVLAVLWRSEDRSRVVARVRTVSSDSVTVSGPDRLDCPLAESLAFRFRGRWDDHPKFGRQYKYDAAILSAPVDRAGMTAYLVTLAECIGEKRAARLWDLYGDQAAEVLRTQPERVVADKVLSEAEAKTASDSLEAFAGREQVLLELLSLLTGRGFGRKLPMEAIALWGERAAQVIRKNPYQLLLRDLPGAGWKRCDKLWLDMGHSASHPKRQVMATIAYLREGHGDTWHDARRVASAITEACGADADPKHALRVAERWKKVTIRRGGERPYVALTEHAKAEERLAQTTRRLLSWSKRARRYSVPVRHSA